MSTYHERVARKMSQTMTVGSVNTYEDILNAVRARFPLEADLRRYVAILEQMTQVVVPGFQYVDEREAGHGTQ